MKRTLATFAALALSAPAFAGEPAKNDPQTPGWYVASSFGLSNVDDQRNTGNGKGVTLAFGHHGEVASIEVAGIFTTLKKYNAQIAGGQIALIWGPFADEEMLSRLYGVFALGAVSETNLPALHFKTGTGLIGDLGFGYRHPILIAERKLNLRFEIRTRADFQMPPREEGQPSYYRDWIFSAGFQIPLSSPPPPPAPPPLPQVVPPVSSPPAQPAESTAQPQDSTAQPAAESSPSAPAESDAPAQPVPP